MYYFGRWVDVVLQILKAIQAQHVILLTVLSHNENQQDFFVVKLVHRWKMHQIRE